MLWVTIIDSANALKPDRGHDVNIYYAWARTENDDDGDADDDVADHLVMIMLYMAMMGSIDDYDKRDDRTMMTSATWLA